MIQPALTAPQANITIWRIAPLTSAGASYLVLAHPASDIRAALDRAAVGTSVAEGMPRRQQLRVLLMQRGLEPAEGAPALDSLRQPSPGSLHG